MDDRFNTIAGWALFSGVVALGLSSLSSHYFQADKTHRPHTMGFEIEGVVSSEGGAAKEVPIETLLASADPAKGAAVFKKCTSCHTDNQGGANGIGPNLYGVVGEAIASPHRSFAFSDALKGVGGNWDFAKLNDWLHNPKKFAPGTKMTFAGLSDGAERANIIAYLNTQGSNLPLPAVPAAEAAEAPKEGEAAAAASGAPEAAAAASGEPEAAAKK